MQLKTSKQLSECQQASSFEACSSAEAKAEVVHFKDDSIVNSAPTTTIFLDTDMQHQFAPYANLNDESVVTDGTNNPLHSRSTDRIQETVKIIVQSDDIELEDGLQLKVRMPSSEQSVYINEVILYFIYLP